MFRWGPSGQLDTICNVKTQVVIVVVVMVMVVVIIVVMAVMVLLMVMVVIVAVLKVRMPSINVNENVKEILVIEMNVSATFQQFQKVYFQMVKIMQIFESATTCLFEVIQLNW